MPPKTVLPIEAKKEPEVSPKKDVAKMPPKIVLAIEAKKVPEVSPRKDVATATEQTRKGSVKSDGKTVKREKYVEKGINGLMLLIQKHAIPKCRKEKVVVEQYEPGPKIWWHRTTCVYALMQPLPGAAIPDNKNSSWVIQRASAGFRHPKIRSRLERLMGSNLVRLTDRKYMLQLHDRILEDYIQSMNKRIAAREAQERNREKELVLTGRIPLDQAPKEMANHPVLLINNYCQKLIAERRAKIKVPKVCIPLYLYLDDTPDPPAGLSIIEGHIFRKPDDLICIPPEVHLSFTNEEDVARGYMFTPDVYEKKKKYENPLVKDLTDVESVEQMYILADQIIGPLKTIKEVSIMEES